VSRRRSLGNVRFIGELYKLQMLTPKIMVECINMLVSTQDEESLECLCKLLTTVGQKLDDQLRENEAHVKALMKENKQPKWVPEAKFMDNTFRRLRDLSVNKALSSRIRFALLVSF
jgi:translation initiation factor 4G